MTASCKNAHIQVHNTKTIEESALALTVIDWDEDSMPSLTARQTFIHHEGDESSFESDKGSVPYDRGHDKKNKETYSIPPLLSRFATDDNSKDEDNYND